MTNTQFQSLEEIGAIPVPYSAEDMRKYQAISHMEVINSIKEEIDKRNLKVQKEVYKVGRFGQHVFGTILTDMKSDADLGGAIHFNNSYDKTRKLQIISGSLVFICDNGCFRFVGEQSQSRKHVGAINIELAFMLDNAFNSLETEYAALVEAKNKMKNIQVDKRLEAELAGRLFIEHDVLSVTQMSIVKQELEKPETPFGAGTAWNWYNACTQALKLSHPADYINNHVKLHEFAMQVF